MKNRLLAIFVMGALVNAAAFAAEGDNSYLAAGFDYSTGKYGTDTTTDILSIPVVGIYQTGLWIFRLTVPYIWITGDGTVIPGMGGAVPGKGSAMSGGGGSKGSASATQSGLGDVIAAATYNIYSASDYTLGVDLTGKVKFGTANANSNLGTGENDYAAQIDVYKKLDRFTTMASLGYRVLGDPPGYDLSNASYGMLGGYYLFTDQTGGGAEMRLSQKLFPTGEGPRELTAYVSHWFDESMRISGYVLRGFSDGSPDSGFGVLLTSAL